jgi:hypothetical protein
VRSDRDVGTLVLRSLHSDLLKDEPEHPRVVHREKHAGDPRRDVLRGEERVEDRLDEVVEIEAGLSKSSGVIRKVTSTSNLVFKGGAGKGACG